MKLDEFKAWFSGFTEDMNGPPTEKQWARIKEQVGAIDGVTVSQTVFFERYRPYYDRWFIGGVGMQNAAPGVGVSNNAAFDSTTALYAAGKMEALSS